MQNFNISPRELASSLPRNRHLILSMIKREVIGRYKGSIIGIVWSFLNPVFMLLVYTFVFSVVFNARWSEGSESKTEFALVLFAGLIVYNLFAECLNKSPALILQNVNYVKKVVFPLEVLPWVNFGAALFHSGISILVWVVAYLFLFGLPHPTIFLLPFVFLPLMFLIMGFSWALASTGVYIRDVSQFIGILTMTLMFLSPIFYPITALPESYRVYLYLNPLTPIIEEARKVLFWGHAPDFVVLGVYLIVSMIVCWLGFAWFQKTRKGFADVL